MKKLNPYLSLRLKTWTTNEKSIAESCCIWVNPFIDFVRISYNLNLKKIK